MISSGGVSGVKIPARSIFIGAPQGVDPGTAARRARVYGWSRPRRTMPTGPQHVGGIPVPADVGIDATIGATPAVLVAAVLLLALFGLVATTTALKLVALVALLASAAVGAFALFGRNAVGRRAVRDPLELTTPTSSDVPRRSE